MMHWPHLEVNKTRVMFHLLDVKISFVRIDSDGGQESPLFAQPCE